MSKSKKISVVSNECVACGCCAKVCPFNAIYVHNGIIAKVNKDRCVGCGKCAVACPACVISVLPRADIYDKKEAERNEEKALV